MKLSLLYDTDLDEARRPIGPMGKNMGPAPGNVPMHQTGYVSMKSDPNAAALRKKKEAERRMAQRAETVAPRQRLRELEAEITQAEKALESLWDERTGLREKLGVSDTGGIPQVKPIPGGGLGKAEA